MEKIIPRKISVTNNSNYCSEVSPRPISEDLLINIFDPKFNKIKTVEDLKEAIERLYIRFNTDPKLYQKSDFGLLVRILIGLFLNQSGKSDIVLGENLSQIAGIRDNVLDLLHPIATDESEIINPEETLSSISYSDNKYILKWETF